MFAVCWFFAVFQPSWSKKIAVCCLLFFSLFSNLSDRKNSAVCCLLFSLFPTFRIKKLFYFCKFLTAEKERLSRVPEGTKSTMMRPRKKKHDAQLGMRVPPANSTRKNRGKVTVFWAEVQVGMRKFSGEIYDATPTIVAMGRQPQWCEKRVPFLFCGHVPFLSSFPMFVPSLSKIVFKSKLLKKGHAFLAGTRWSASVSTSVSWSGTSKRPEIRKRIDLFCDTILY